MRIEKCKTQRTFHASRISTEQRINYTNHLSSQWYIPLGKILLYLPALSTVPCPHHPLHLVCSHNWSLGTAAGFAQSNKELIGHEWALQRILISPHPAHFQIVNVKEDKNRGRSCSVEHGTNSLNTLGQNYVRIVRELSGDCRLNTFTLSESLWAPHYTGG